MLSSYPHSKPPMQPPYVAPVHDAEVTVVIPTFNRGTDLVRALHAIEAQSVRNLRAIVVDNSSTDDTPQRIAALQPAWAGRLGYLRKEPEGPAAARNLGLRAASTPFVLFQDSDVELDPDWVRRALARMEADPLLGAVGGRIVYAFDPARVNAYGGELGWFGLAWDVDEGAPLREDAVAAERVWINCSAMLVRREATLAAGAFDPDFFYGFEDTDLGWRLRIAGHRVQVVPELLARHHVEAATGPAHGTIVFHYCKNRLRMLLRDTQARRLPRVLGTYLLYAMADALLRAPRLPKLRALAWNLARLPATLALRRATQAGRRTADADILACGTGRGLPPTRLGGQRRRGLPEAAVLPPGAGTADDRV